MRRTTPTKLRDDIEHALELAVCQVVAEIVSSDPDGARALAYRRSLIAQRAREELYRYFRLGRKP